MSPKRGKERNPSGNAIRGGLLVLILLLGAAVFMARSFKTVIVEGTSMEPYLKPGDELMVTSAYWLLGRLKRNDIVLVKAVSPDDGYYIKRVYRLGGETIPASDLLHLPERHDLSLGDYVVPPDTVYVVGDNLPDSHDSRQFGPVTLENILGKAVRF